MHTKNTHPSALLCSSNVDPVIRLYFQINHLKQLYRQGWLKRGITEWHCESVADHIFAMAFLALAIIKHYNLTLDVSKVLSMCLSHELGEIIAGDITPVDGISAEEKYQLERAALITVLEGFPSGHEYLALWEEFEEGKTAEARFVFHLDKLELVMQAWIYKHQHPVDLEAFFPHCRKHLSDPLIVSLFEEIVGVSVTK